MCQYYNWDMIKNPVWTEFATETAIFSWFTQGRLRYLIEVLGVPKLL